MYRIVIDISLYVCVFTGGSEEVLLRKSKIKSDSGWQMSEEDQLMAGNIYSPQFFCPSAFPFLRSQTDSVFQGWCVPVWSQERMIVAHAPSLSPSLSLSHTLTQFVSWANERIPFADSPPPSLSLSVIDTFSLLCPMFCSHCSKIFLSFPSVSASTLPYVYLLSLSPQSAIIFLCVNYLLHFSLSVSENKILCFNRWLQQCLLRQQVTNLCVCVCVAHVQHSFGVWLRWWAGSSRGLTERRDQGEEVTMEEWIQKYELRREWIFGFKETIDLILGKQKYLGESQPNIEYL